MSVDVSNLGSFLIKSIRSEDITLQGVGGNDLIIKADPAATGSYTLSLPPATGAVGQILTSLGGGQTAWQNPTGAITSASNTADWVFNGSQAGISGTANMIDLAGGVITTSVDVCANAPVNVKNTLTVTDSALSNTAFVVNNDASSRFVASNYDKFFQFYENPILSSPTGQTYTADQLVGGLIIRQGATTVTDTIPLGADIITALGNVINRGVLVYIKNENSGDLTINGNTGVSEFSETVIAPQVTACFILRQLNNSTVALHCLHCSGA